MDDSCLCYIHVNTPTDDCFPPYIKAQPSFDSIDSSRTIRSAATSRSHSTNSSTTATPALPTAYTEPSTPSFKNGLFQHDIQIPTSMSLSIPALDEQVRVRRAQARVAQRHARNRSEMSMPVSTGGIQMHPSHLQGHHQGLRHHHAHAASIGNMTVNVDGNGSPNDGNGNCNGSGTEDKVATDCPRCGIWTWNVNRHMKYRCKERRGPMNHIPRTSAPLNLNSMDMNLNSMETDLATYVKQLESKSHMMERMAQSVQHRNEVLENEKAEMSSSISSLVKQVQWLSRKVNVTLQEVDRLNQFIAEQGGQAQG